MWEDIGDYRVVVEGFGFVGCRGVGSVERRWVVLVLSSRVRMVWVRLFL